MERRGFLKSISMLAATLLIPKQVVSAIEVIEKKAEPKGIGSTPYNFPLTDHAPYTNHMSIQRKSYAITGKYIQLEMGGDI